MVIATVMAPDLESIEQGIERSFAQGADAVEIRFDAAPGVDPSQVGTSAGGPLLATYRARDQGGRFDGNEAERVRAMEGAATTGRFLLDVELGSGAERLLDASPESVGVVSHHDVRSTSASSDSPDDLDTLARRLLAAARPWQIAKLVTTARSAVDAMRIRSVLGTFPEALACFAMGEHGRFTRVLSGVWGSAAIWAAASAGAPGAPAQIDLGTLLGRYRYRQLSARTTLFGLLGSPIAHSLSPAIHNSVFAGQGIDAVYLPMECGSAAEAVMLIEALPLAGISLTAPLKVAIVPHLTHRDPMVESAKACNTILARRAGAGGTELHGFNTDCAALLDEVQERVVPAGRSAIVFGSGGAARAAAVALSQAGSDVAIAARDNEAGAALARELGVRFVPLAEARGAEGAILVQATAAPAEARLLSGEGLAGAFALDMRYGPVPSRFLRDVRSAGIPAVDGLGMLVRQAQAQALLFTGRTVPLADMLRTAQAALEEPTGTP